MKNKCLHITLALGLGLTLALLWLLSHPGTETAVAYPVSCTVCPAGPPICDYSTIQAAVDACCDVIKVAAGIYTDVNNHGGLAQVVYISKSVTIRGGYTLAFTEPPDPEVNRTTLNAQGQGRVLYITGDISTTIEGLRITGGNAEGLGGYASPGGYTYDAGGGVYVINATVAFSVNRVYDNGCKGIFSYGDCFGGGLFLEGSDATLITNTVFFNSAGSNFGSGGGLFLEGSVAALSTNTISSNSSGGLYLSGSDVVLDSNIVSGNGCYGGDGGLSLHDSDATLTGNTISDNHALFGNGGLGVSGGNVTFVENTISYNSSGDYYPSPASSGGLSLYDSDATLTGNTISHNTVSCNFYDGHGGGLALFGGDATLINNTISHNTVDCDGYGISGFGGGIYNSGGTVTIVNSTLSGNGADDGGGIYDSGTVAIRNSIVANSPTGGNCSGTITSNDYNLSGDDTCNFTADHDMENTDPLLGPLRDNGGPTETHALLPCSPAIDGVTDPEACTVKTDQRGVTRPQGAFCDIGAYEFPPDQVSPPDDMALNPSRSGYPHPLESDDGWGGGSDKWEIVDGVRMYPEWDHGLAFTGGMRPYIEPCGWRQATINFGELKTFNRVVVWHHGLDHVPNTYKIQYWDGTSWVDVFSTTNGHAYLMYPTDSPRNWWESSSTPTENTFDPVTSSKVRFTFDNCDISHGWIYEFEVYAPELWAVEYRWGDPPPGFSFAEWPIFVGWMNVRIENRSGFGGDAFSVTATVTDWPANTEVPNPDVTVGDIPAGCSAWSEDTFTVRVSPYPELADPCEGVTWRIEYDDAAGLHHVIENVPQFPPGEGPCD